ncbi:phosphatase 2C-like domain-containing protein [Mycena floridula]|nr:phosphatase 2C-like domain-containing protein [Mycena floridula]
MSGTSLTTSKPLSTLSTMQKRFYTGLSSTSSTRVRSNSATSRTLYTSNTLTFFDTPPSPRPNVLTTTRIAVEARGEVEGGQTHLPFSLAFTAPKSNTHSSSSAPPHVGPYSLFPYSSLSIVPPTLSGKSAGDPSSSSRRQRFQLDIGGYGIPKKSRATYLNSSDRQRLMGNQRMLHTRNHQEDLNLAVQVGEDAYFIRENAMGVADGVGGWNRAKCPPLPQSPSALFAQRLMHFSSSEVASSSRSKFLHPQPRPCPAPLLSTSLPWYWSTTEMSPAELQENLEESLEDLEEGIDVLMILERAYQSTLKSHVVPAQKSTAPLPTSPSLSPPSPLPCLDEKIPLLAGSSTALLAVLDHVPRKSTEELSPSEYEATEYEAVVKIAHIGDCMGMLVRGDEIAWRSEEMWWSFNTPVQLGPASSSISPQSSAHVFTLPVQADDILILASDGLSDNLWDEDILDEVVRFRKGYLQSSPEDVQSSPEPSPSSSNPTTAADRIRWRRALAGMLSEALCSRARRVSERRDGEEDEVPFARRARENGKHFTGGKNDDISVVVAVISPAADLAMSDT